MGEMRSVKTLVRAFERPRRGWVDNEMDLKELEFEDMNGFNWLTIRYICRFL
jgi:hypothetical protein